MWIPRAELETLLGEEQAYKLMFHFGNRRIYIPQRVKESGQIAQCIGIESAEKLSREYARLTVEIPSVIRRKTAKQEVMELLSAGANNVAKIAAIAGVSKRYIERVKKEWLEGQADSHQRS